jgi:hypothetical protein
MHMSGILILLEADHLAVDVKGQRHSDSGENGHPVEEIQTGMDHDSTTSG